MTRWRLNRLYARDYFLYAYIYICIFYINTVISPLKSQLSEKLIKLRIRGKPYRRASVVIVVRMIKGREEKRVKMFIVGSALMETVVAWPIYGLI